MRWSWPLCCFGTAYLVGLSGLGGVVMYSEVISDTGCFQSFWGYSHRLGGGVFDLIRLVPEPPWQPFSMVQGYNSKANTL